MILPDASNISTALFGSTLTMNSGTVFQWVYNSPTAEGTIALGSQILNLPTTSGSLGNPVFRPVRHPALIPTS